MEQHRSTERENAARFALEAGRAKSGDNVSKLDNDQAAWHDRLRRNYWAVYITIYCMSLEIPFQRYIMARPSSLFLARLRFFGMLLVFVRLLMFLALSDCEHATWRAYLYDWTIYYPTDRRANIQRVFIGGVIYNLCLKISVFHYKRKSFNPSLIDYLCSKPPAAANSPHQTHCEGYLRETGRNRSSTSITSNSLFRNFPVSGARALKSDLNACQLKRRRTILNKDSNFLRDRAHWFELSDLVWSGFKTNAIIVISLCTAIMISANRRLGVTYIVKDRKCDVEMPLLRTIGLIELNLLLIECTNTLIGSFCYCSMVKGDLMVQARNVENYLTELITDIKLNTSLESHVISAEAGVNRRSTPQAPGPLPLEKHNLTKSLALVNFPGHNSILFGGLHSKQRMHELISGSAGTHKLKFLPLQFANQGIECPKFYPSSRHASISSSSQTTTCLLVSSQMMSTLADEQSNICDSNMFLESIREQPIGYADHHEGEEKLKTCERLTNRIVEAQNRVILFLRCIDSHKQAISFVGNSFLMWMLASISFVPLLVVSARGTLVEHFNNLGYAMACIIALSTGLMFTYIGATVHKRATNLTWHLFRICSLYHSQAVAVRWNKIFMIWFCPSRCAFKVSGIFKLTHLNMLKAVSFLVSGLTLVLNYLA